MQVRRGAVALLLAVWPAPASGVATTLSVERIAADGWTLERVAAELRYADADAEASLRLRIAALRGPSLSLTNIDWRCDWILQPVKRCEGPLRVAGKPAGTLALQQDASLGLRWAQAGQSVEATFLPADGALQARLRALPVSWLQPLLSAAMPELRITSGSVGGDVRRAAADGDLTANLSVHDLGIDSEAGDIAAAGISGSLQVVMPADAHVGTTVDAEFAGGEVLYGPLYAPLAAGSRLGLVVRDEGGGYRLDDAVRWSDPEGLQLQFMPRAANGWALELRSASLQRSGERYLGSVLAAAGLGGAQLSGAAEIDLQGEGGDLLGLRATLRESGLEQAGKGLLVAGLDGALHWNAGGESPPSMLRWQALELYAVPLGAATLALRGSDGRLQLEEPLRLRPFDGGLVVGQGWFDPQRREAEFAVDVESLSLAALSDRAGWLPFTGRISGRLPRARYSEQRLVVDGTLGIDVFGGRVAISDLILERPLGVAPTLSADITLDDLDLTPLTGAFGFGAISGRLDGRVAGLRLLDWTPVAFDAVLQTDPDYRGERRISQRAVEDIGKVGGGSGGIQNSLLKVFDSFGYRRIGLRCRLANNVCSMGGIEDSGTGYVLIEGAGLPRVTVNGFQRRVDWPVLLARLQAATRGGIKFD